MTRSRPRVVVIGGSREAAILAGQLPDATLLDGDSLPDRFGADAVIDGSHPCERQTQLDVAARCERQGIPFLRLRRPPWQATPADRWIEVDSAETARSVLEPGWLRVFLCLGAEDRSAFIGDPSRWYLVRSRRMRGTIIPLDDFEITAKNGPFAVEDEGDLMKRRGIDVLVTRNAGGDGAAPKILAARALGLPVVLLNRPPSPGAEVESVEGALAWLAGL